MQIVLLGIACPVIGFVIGFIFGWRARGVKSIFEFAHSAIQRQRELFERLARDRDADLDVVEAALCTLRRGPQYNYRNLVNLLRRCSGSGISFTDLGTSAAEIEEFVRRSSRFAFEVDRARFLDAQVLHNAEMHLATLRGYAEEGGFTLEQSELTDQAIKDVIHPLAIQHGKELLEGLREMMKGPNPPISNIKCRAQSIRDLCEEHSLSVEDIGAIRGEIEGAMY